MNSNKFSCHVKILGVKCVHWVLALPSDCTLSVTLKFFFQQIDVTSAPHVYINCGHVHGFHVWGKSTDQTEEERPCPICREVCFHITYTHYMYTSTVATSMAFMFGINLPIKQKRKDRVLYVEKYVFILLICSTYIHQLWPCPHLYINCGHVHGFHVWGKSTDQTEEERPCPICREVCFHITYMHHIYTSTVAMSMGFMFGVNLPIKQKRKDHVLYVERYVFILLICTTSIHQLWPCPWFSCLG